MSARRKEATKSESKSEYLRPAGSVALYQSHPWKPTVETTRRIIDIANKIASGLPKEGIYTYIRETYGVGARQARTYYEAANIYLLPEEEDEFRRKMIYRNFNRLDELYDYAIETNNNFMAIKVLAEQNKLLKAENKVTLKETPEGERSIEISFD